MSVSLSSSPSKAFASNNEFSDRKSRNISNTFTIIEHDLDSPSASSVSMVSSPFSLDSGWFGGFADYSMATSRVESSTAEETANPEEKEDSVDQARSSKVGQESRKTQGGPVLQALRPISELVMDQVISESRFLFPRIEESSSTNGSQRSTSVSSNSTTTSSSSSTSATSTNSSFTSKSHRRSTSSSIHSLLPIDSRTRSASRFSSSPSPSMLRSTLRDSVVLHKVVQKSSVTSSITKASASCISISVASNLNSETLKPVVVSSPKLHSSTSPIKSPTSTFNSQNPTEIKDIRFNSTSSSLIKAPFRNPFTSVAEQELRLAHAHILLRDDAARRRTGSLRRSPLGEENETSGKLQRKRSWSTGGTSTPRALPSSPSNKSLSNKSGYLSPNSPNSLPRNLNLNTRHKRSATTSDISRLGVGFEMRAKADGSGLLGVEGFQSINNPMISPRSGLEGSEEDAKNESRSQSFFLSTNLPSSPSSIDSRTPSYVGSGLSRNASFKGEKMLLRPSASLSAHLNQKELKLSGFRQHSESRMPSNLSIRERRIASSKLKKERERAAESEETREGESAGTSQIETKVKSSNDSSNSKMRTYTSASFVAPQANSHNSTTSFSRSSNYSRAGSAYAPKQREFREPLPLSRSSSDVKRSDGESLRRSSSTTNGLPRIRSNLPPLSPPTSPIGFGRSSQVNESESDNEVSSFGSLLKRSNTITGLPSIKSIVNSATAASSSRVWHTRTTSSPTAPTFTSSKHLTRSNSSRWIDSNGQPLRVKVDVDRASTNSSLKVPSREDPLPSPISPTDGETGWERKQSDLRLRIDSCETGSCSSSNQGGLYRDDLGGLTPPLTATSGYHSSGEESDKFSSKEGGNSLLAVSQYISSRVAIPSSSSVQSLLSFNFNLSTEDLHSDPNPEYQLSSKSGTEKSIGYLSPPILPSWIRKRTKSSTETPSKPTRVTSPSWSDDSVACPSNPIPIVLPSSASSYHSPSSSSNKDRSNKLRPHPRSDWSQDQQKQQRERKVNKEKREREFSQRSLVSLQEHHDEIDEHLSSRHEARNGKDHSSMDLSRSHLKPIHSQSSTCIPAHSSSNFMESRLPRRSKTQDESTISTPSFSRMTSFSSSASDTSSTLSPSKSSRQYRPAFRSNASLFEQDDQASTWEDQLSSF